MSVINREEAIEALERMLNYCEEIDGHLPEDERTGYKMFPDYELIYEYLRGSTAERVGKWMEQERGIHTTKYRCSECGRVVWDDTGYDVCTDYPYCNCGARVEGEKDE